jgi:predicted DsbA family dithiol-disulfide isomerase
MTAGEAAGFDDGRRLRIDLWGDVACPWCYIGKRRLENAIETSGLTGEIDLVLHTFELDPDAPNEPVANAQYVARHLGVSIDHAIALEEEVGKVATEVGLPFTALRIHARSHDALRLIQLAKTHGAANELMTVVQHALFTGGADTYTHTFLADSAVQVGIPRVQAMAVLESNRYAEAVRADRAEALQLGATGVPFAVFGEQYGVAGAVSHDDYLKTINTAWGNA